MQIDMKLSGIIDSTDNAEKRIVEASLTAMRTFARPLNSLRRFF